MASVAGWLAALGGLLTVLGQSLVWPQWVTYLGGIIAVIFGLWAALAK